MIKVIHTCDRCGATAEQTLEEWKDGEPEGWFELQEKQYCSKHLQVLTYVVEDRVR